MNSEYFDNLIIFKLLTQFSKEIPIQCLHNVFETTKS
jgi:hypothetical protein